MTLFLNLQTGPRVNCYFFLTQFSLKLVEFLLFLPSLAYFAQFFYPRTVLTEFSEWYVKVTWMDIDKLPE